MSMESISTCVDNYQESLQATLSSGVLQKGVPVLAQALLEAYHNNNRVYVCGNGGSAANANHIANDLLYGGGKLGLSVESLSSNVSVISCLANDIGYENIYSDQLRVKANPDDILLVLSGSGNSKNIINAVSVANDMGVSTYAILGFSGGECKSIVDHAIHFPIHDMQISEDLQLVVGHICMKWLSNELSRGNI